MRVASDIGLLIAAGIIVYLVASRLLGPRNRNPVSDSLVVVMARAAGDAGLELGRHGHRMTWRDSGDGGGCDRMTGTCQSCAGTAILSGVGIGSRDSEIGLVTCGGVIVEYQPPLAADGQLQPCTGGGDRG